jgi:hypothetical protein
MPSKPCRPFTLLDGTILVAGLAIGTAWMRPNLDQANAYFVAQGTAPSLLNWIGLRIEQVRASLHVATLLSITLLVLRLRSPRPSRRRLLCQPGFVASLAVTIGLVLEMAFWNSANAIIVLESPRWTWDNLLDASHWGVHGAFENVAVIVGWSLLLAGKRWRPEPGWLDRTAFWLGLYWMVLPPVTTLTWNLARVFAV